jgi:hypothetical protein
MSEKEYHHADIRSTAYRVLVCVRFFRAKRVIMMRAKPTLFKVDASTSE